MTKQKDKKKRKITTAMSQRAPKARVAVLHSSNKIPRTNCCILTRTALMRTIENEALVCRILFLRHVKPVSCGKLSTQEFETQRNQALITWHGGCNL